MSRKLLFVALLAAVPFTPLRAQDQDQQQSLGDIARQARKAKEDQSKTAAASKGVITEDSLPSRHTPQLLSSAAAPGNAAPGNTGNISSAAADKFAAASADFDQYEQALNEMDPMNRSELARTVLEGNVTDFPGRSPWEDKMFAAKQTYVAHGRGMLREARQLLAQAQALNAGPKTAATASQARELQDRISQLMQDGSRAEGAFQSVVTEGQQMAKQSASR